MDIDTRNRIRIVRWKKDEWNKTVSDREWLIFNGDGTYTLKDGDLKQTIRRHTDTELVLEEFNKEQDFEYKNTKTYRYEK